MAWWNWFRRKNSLEAEIDSELRFHINELTREKIAAGLTPEQARREAILEFGGSEQIKEEVRDVHQHPRVENTFAVSESGRSADTRITVILGGRHSSRSLSPSVRTAPCFWQLMRFFRPLPFFLVSAS